LHIYQRETANELGTRERHMSMQRQNEQKTPAKVNSGINNENDFNMNQYKK